MKKRMKINGMTVDVILPKGMIASDIPNEINSPGGSITVNVGIKSHQKHRIQDSLEYGESINKFVQEAVDEKLDALVGVGEQ